MLPGSSRRSGRSPFSPARQDVTDARHAQDSLKASEASLAFAQQIACVGSIDWNLETREARWSDQLYRILGMEPGEMKPRLANCLRFVHRDDRVLALSHIRELHRTGKGNTVDLRMRTQGGSNRVVNATSVVVYDRRGKTVRQLTTVQDVTEGRKLEERLRKSEEFLLRAQEIAHLGSWAVDSKSGDVTWSNELYRICAIRPDEWDGRVASFIDEMVHPEDRAKAEDAWRAMLETRGACDVEHRIVRPDGSERIVVTRGKMTTDDSGEALSVVGVTQDVTDIRHAERELRRYQEKLRSLANAVSAAAERERRRIGAELHDRTIQSLGYLRVKLAELRAAASTPSTEALFADVFSILEGSISETRALLQEVGPPLLYELGFEPAVEWLAEQAELTYGVRCSVVGKEPSRGVAGDTRIVLFQAVRELLTNVGKHACAKIVEISITGEDDVVRVCVADDGVGFDAVAAVDSPSASGGVRAVQYSRASRSHRR